jgi:hypothetical protein
MNANRRIAHLSERLNDYQRIVMLTSQHKIAGVARILSVALRNGGSPKTICTKLHRAIDGTYSPHSDWTPREFDVAFLIKAIGGPRLLYSLQKAEGYPSLSTLRARKPIPELIVSAGTPTKDEISANISALLGENGRKPPTKQSRQVQIVIDGAAIEEGVRFDFKQRSLVGLCCEHSQDIKTSIDNIQDIYNVSIALYGDESDQDIGRDRNAPTATNSTIKPSCHLGKDATVLGIAPITDEENYHVTTLVLSASCKTEKGEDLSEWISRFIEIYRTHPDGEARHGPIHTLATDGESSFRRLRFILCLKEPLDKTSLLGQKLTQLPGLNLQTGSHGILGTCDPKHIIKRFATLIRSPKGIQVGNTHVTSGNVLRALENLMSPEKAALLLNPADKQNVPKAVNLIQSLGDLEKADISGTPSEKERLRCIIFIANVLGNFLLPFISVDMSLSEQLRHLSAYSHLITALYLRHGLSFMTSALFADSQAIVKNIFFTAMRLQIADPNTLYYILFEGTDRLENIFSHARTQDHARNFDILQLSHKLSIGAEIDAIFQRHPDLDRGHIRRNLSNARGIDHTNPKSWNGNVRVGDVDILSVYLAGRKDANDLLVKHFHGQSAAVDFNRLFSEPNVDHLRPKKEYVGSRGADDEESELGDHTSRSQTALASESDPLDDEFEDTQTAIDQEQFNHFGADFQNKNLLNPSAKDSDAHYLIVDETKHYIPTLITNLLSRNRELRTLVTTRGLRAQGETIEKALRKKHLQLNSSGDNLDVSGGKIKAGDLGAILVRTGLEICLAVGEILNFRQGTSNINLASVNISDLDGKSSKSTTIAMQFLQLVAHQDTNQSDSKLTWWWPQEYIQIQDSQRGPVIQRHFVLRVPGRLFHPLSPSIIHNSAGHPIWSLSHSSLEEALGSAWASLDPDSNSILQTISDLPIILGPGLEKLPYRLLEDEAWMLCIPKEDIPIQLDAVKLSGDDERKCHFCNTITRISMMRQHVGQHILKAHRDVEDESLEDEKEVRLFLLIYPKHHSNFSSLERIHVVGVEGKAAKQI